MKRSKILEYDAAEKEQRREARRQRKAERKANRNKGGVTNMYGYGYGGYGYGYGYGNYGGYAGYTPATGYKKTEPQKLTEDEEKMFKAMAAARGKVYASYTEAMADPNPKVDSFFPSPTGWMVLQRRVIDGNTMIFVKKADKCPLAEEVQPHIELTINNRIPKELLVEIVGSFARICRLNGNEAAAQIYREKEPAEGSTERKYVVYYPEQTISGASVTYANDQGMLKMRETHDLIMELHSHNRMSAFWSGTDNANEKDCGFYMVIGTFGSAAATYKCRVKYGDLYNDFEAHKIFDMTPDEETELLKRENWSEGNPIIEERAKAHGSVHASNLTTRTGGTTTTGGSGYGINGHTASAGGRLGVLPTVHKERYEKLVNQVIKRDDPMGDILWRYAKWDSKRAKYVCESHVFDVYYGSGSAWVPVAQYADETKDNPLLDDVYKRYIRTLEEAFNPEACTQARPKTYMYKYAESGAACVDYLLGATEDSDARQMGLPGKKMEYYSYCTPDYIEGLNDNNFKEAVERQAIARVVAAENIQTAFNYNTGEATLDSEFMNKDFRQAILEKVDAATVSDQFDPTLMWELLTPMEKNRLAITFGETVVNMAKMFTGHVGKMCYQFIIFMYWAILVPQNYRLKLMEAVEALRELVKGAALSDDASEVNIVSAMNALFVANPNALVDILKPVNTVRDNVVQDDEVQANEVQEEAENSDQQSQ